ncbi:hypothetical protein CKO_04325 [Citrobacter koseri ATCC BAA-895]|uniref:Uncharacterized protein n=1 Tax=Citrobacter koseri (strain ATCC BAA-895 / CDC 4225-83 / SGSC4696) TaxID=290338 RepID=A8APG9_CITK8|nr:hypothetical protein CKO_04325 [Citrobacter koseri ATCC BAA-895]
MPRVCNSGRRRAGFSERLCRMAADGLIRPTSVPVGLISEAPSGVDMEANLSALTLLAIRQFASVTLLEIAFEDDDGRGGIHLAFVECAITALFKQARTRFYGAEAFVMQRNQYAKTAMNAVGELAGASGEGLLCAIHIER